MKTSKLISRLLIQAHHLLKIYNKDMNRDIVQDKERVR
jgi:hypothetical protein